jgi:hypothetical protein
MKILLLLTLLLNIACLEQDSKKKDDGFTIQDSDSLPNMILHLVDPYYQSGQLALINSEKKRATTGLNRNTSGYEYLCYQADVFRLGRFNINNFTRYNLGTPEKVEAQFSTNGKEAASNPKSLVMLDSGLALLSRYASSNLWVINPYATDANNFLYETIDLSQYADSDGNPELEHMILDGDFVYLFLNRIKRTSSVWTFPKNTLVLKMDAHNFEIVETLELDVANVYGEPIVHLNKMYIPATHNLFQLNKKRAGLQVIDLDSFTKEKVLFAGRQIEHVAATSQGIYFIEYLGYMKNKFLHYDPLLEVESDYTPPKKTVTLLKSYQDELYLGLTSGKSSELLVMDAKVLPITQVYTFDFMPVSLSFCGN